MKEKRVLLFIGSFSAIAAGLIHIFIVGLGHGSILPHLLAFSIGGILQIALGIFIWFENFIKQTYISKNIVHGGFIFMLLFSFFLPIPFVGTSEGVSVLGIGTIILQLLAIVTLFPIYMKFSKNSIQKEIYISIGIALFSGIGAFGIGYLAEHIFPEYKSNNIGGHHGGFGHHH
ncbi:MAG: hypothetical protein GY828_01180 [Candidatus Gracilibacteria bacterium]|nr:hypothetical protein [Candidatus Gracilibacteria bacterium]